MLVNIPVFSACAPQCTCSEYDRPKLTWCPRRIRPSPRLQGLPPPPSLAPFLPPCPAVDCPCLVRHKSPCRPHAVRLCLRRPPRCSARVPRGCCVVSSGALPCLSCCCVWCRASFWCRAGLFVAAVRCRVSFRCRAGLLPRWAAAVPCGVVGAVPCRGCRRCGLPPPRVAVPCRVAPRRRASWPLVGGAAGYEFFVISWWARPG